MKARPEPLPDPLDETGRVDWGVAVLVFLELAIVVPLIVLWLTGFLGILPFLGPLLVFLLLRVPGDIARALAGTRPHGLAIEGPAKGAAWATVPHGVAWTFGMQSIPGPFWLAGSSIALLGLALWGHHARALPHAPRVARLEGITGAALAPFGLAAASTYLADTAPWSVVVPACVLLVAAALAARGIVNLVRRDPRAPVRGGWTGWYHSHFFRLTLLLGAVLVYLFVRDTLAGFVPFLFLFEYSFAVFVAAGFLWSLRAFARKATTERVPIGPHTRHTQAIERQGEAPFDEAEEAFGTFLETGDPGPVAALAADLERDGVHAEGAFSHVLRHRGARGLLLLHPGWLYAARLAFVLIVAASLRATLPGTEGAAAAWLVVAGGVYSAQWNRFGAPWPVKTALGYAGAAAGLVFLTLVAALPVLLTPLGAMLGLLALVLPLVHPLRARRGRPTPRYLYAGQDPREAIGPLIQRADRSIIVRAAWLTGLGIVFFLIISELARVFTGLDVLFSLYLALAFAFLVHPLLLSVGLRTGRQEARRRAERARKAREQLLEQAFARLTTYLEAEAPSNGST